ncbi:TadE/TadG family type IV pilus assembly protein [Aliiruegeria lutimaris]|uniref:TadE-like protein n=1 Tax=Aliiruegeria lutimaris TaxID=571298 RepID=A0A1G8XJW2_9RHOB|nr:TadE family protein [Aliiruegeria lutimaris]SDJ90869.1 TadE-like protein [Aliiruegeria lutimaris]
MATLWQRIRKWFRAEDGSMAIEFVIMVPLFVAMISGVVDLSRVYVDQANYYSIARDTARIVARHGMTETTAETYATTRLNEVSDAQHTVDVSTTSTEVTVFIAAPIEVLAKFDFLDFLADMTITATVTHALEPS